MYEGLSATARPTRPDARADVLICGAGPNGLMLAIELALAGVRPLVLDRLTEPSSEPRANGLVGQVVRLMDLRGLYAELSGLPGPPRSAPAYIFSGMPLRLDGLEPNPMHGIAIPQPVLVRKLYARALALGVDVRWGHELTGLEPDEPGVRARVAGPAGEFELRARFLVGADGGKSLVRKLSGIDFSGHTSGAVSRSGHVSLPAELRTTDGGLEVPGVGRMAFGHNRLERGMFVFAEMEPGRPIVGVTEFPSSNPSPGARPGTDPGARAEDSAPMTLDELRAAVRRVLGVDLPFGPPTGPGPHALRRITGQNTRLADRYRAGSVFLLGDAAHVHAGIGGPGLNLGLQDAANLGWKLAAHLGGWAPQGLLETYEEERRPIGERVMTSTLAQMGLMLPGPEQAAVRALFGELLELPAVTAHIANLLAGSDIRYATGNDHPLSGRMVPDLTVRTADGPTRFADLMHAARPVLLDPSGDGRFGTTAQPWSDRVTIVEAAPAAGFWRDTPALLVRPDGYVAWAADPSDSSGPTDGEEAEGLRDALGRWFGAPVTAPIPA